MELVGMEVIWVSQEVSGGCVEAQNTTVHYYNFNNTVPQALSPASERNFRDRKSVLGK